MPAERIGKVVHYWPRVGAAQIELEKHVLRVGEKIKIVGRGHAFEQEVASLEIDHVAKDEGRPGEFVSIAVDEPVRDEDEVWRVD